MSKEDNNWKIGLWATAQHARRYRQHCLVIYLAFDTDWTSYQLERNGNYGPPLAVANATPEAVRISKESMRARSFQYDGQPPANPRGFAEDLRTLGLDRETIAKFLIAAASHWLGQRPAANERSESLSVVRMGEVHPEGCYFSEENGGSTYGDSAEIGVGKRYRLIGAVADTRVPAIARDLVVATLADPRLDAKARGELFDALEYLEEGGGLGYMIFDETPMADAARRLGWDAVRVVENDDLPGSASSIFVLNIDRVKLARSPSIRA